ncbi:MAG TPA: diiron oxygenase, partial [Nocardioides sp.]|nr:diiron oxygenase [Nocardioides sp.]
SQTDWYRSLPKARQVEVARQRMTAITKTGSQFEQLLLLGGTQFLMGLQNENPEFRYFMHELTEECHHIQMFQEFTNRSAPEVSGAPQWLMKAIPAVSLLGSIWPTLFFQIILAGEEPIDHVQKNILRTGGIHPLLDRIMAIHAAEEARHIGFAHAWLEHHAPEMGALNRYALGLLTPLVMRLGIQAIMAPSAADAELMGIPDDVVRDTFSRRNAVYRRMLVEVSADVRAGCEQTGLLTPRTRWAWRYWGVDGRASRFRAEPVPAVA